MSTRNRKDRVSARKRWWFLFAVKPECKSTPHRHPSPRKKKVVTVAPKSSSSGHHVEHSVEKTSPPAKNQENEKSGGGGLFSDDDDLVTSGHSSSVASSKPSVAKKTSKPVDLFGDADDADDDDDSLFGEKPAKKEEPKTRASKKKLPAGAVSIFGASPPPLFSASSTANEPAESVVSATSGISDAKNAGTKVGGGLFSEDDLTSSFSSEKTAPSVTTPVVPAAVKPRRKTTQISLFDDQDDEEDGDDLFASIAPSKGMASGKTAKVSKSKEPKEEKKNVVSKPTAKRSTISLFDDDDDDDDDDGNVKDGSNIFNTKPVTSSEQNKATAKESKPASKAAVKASGGLFGSEEDLLFTGTLKAKPSDPLVMNKKAENKLSTKPTEARSPMLNVDEDEEDDLFAEPRTKPPSTDPLLGNEEQTTGREAVTSAAKQKGPIHLDDEDDLFGESKKKTPTSDPLVADATAPVDTGSKEDTMKSSQNVRDNDNQTEDKEIDEDDGAKIPPGAVPMFGGVNIFAAQTPGKGKRQPPGGGLFGDDEDDLFAATSHPKPIPSAAPRSKPPKKPHVPTPPKTSSSPVSQPPIPVQRSVPVVSSAEKNTNVGKLQKTLAFNPAAMLPGAVPPLKKHENLVEATFDKPVSEKTLESSARNRVRIHAKRRPPTRQARRTAAKESMDDSSLFGSTISSSVPSVPEERLAVEGRKPASLFSDSDDLFSSNSYEAPEKTEQTYTTKSDPFFNTNKTIAAPPASSFCADSVDAVSQEKLKSNVETAKDDVSKIERQKTTTKTATDSPFREKSDDDLFSGSVEDKSSSQKVNVIRDDEDDEDDEDDLFKSSSRPLFSPPPLDFDSEASTSNDFANYIEPKPSNDELFPENSKLKNDIFSPLPSAARTDEKTMEKEKKKDEQNTTDQNDLDKKDSETRSKEIGAKTSNLVDDLFGDTGSIFDDVPKKPKEKKKKKTTVSKEESIFDEPKDLAADEDVTSVKTTKKTKGKKKVEKKGKSKISIFDEDSPSIFDDPLNATASK